MGAPVLLQTYPRGLLGWLKQRIGGAAPDQVATVLQPTIDAGRLYRDLRNDNTVVAPSAVPFTNQVGWTVPSSQRWELMSFTCSVDMNSPEALPLQLGVQTPTGETYYLSAPAVLINNAGLTRSYGLAATIPEGLLLDPGSSLVVTTLSGSVGGPWAAILTASWYSMDV